MAVLVAQGVQAASEGRAAAVRTRTEGVVSKPFMTWEQVAALRDAGWEIGAHTATHCKLADHHAEHGDAGVEEEAVSSNALFAANLGEAPRHFAYPSGSRTDRTDEILSVSTRRFLCAPMLR